MPNWASVSYVVEFEDRDMSTKVYNDLSKVMDKDYNPIENGFGNWVGTLFYLAGFTEKEILDSEEIRCRGSVDFMQHYDDRPAIEFQFTMAWADNYDSMVKLFKKYTDKFNLYMIVEECGVEYYAKVDPNDKYFEDNYYVDLNLNDDYYSEYFINKKVAVDYLNESLGLNDLALAEKLADNEQELADYVSEHFDEGSCGYLYEFKQVDGYFELE